MTLTRSCACALAKVCAALAALFCGSPALPAMAQGSTATIEVRAAAPPNGDTAAKIPVQLLSIADPLQSWTADMVGGEIVRFRLVPPGAYRVVSGDVEQRVEVASGDE